MTEPNTMIPFVPRSNHEFRYETGIFYALTKAVEVLNMTFIWAMVLP